MAHEDQVPDHIRDALDAYRDSRVIIANIRDMERDSWVRLAGPRLYDMLASKEETEQRLSDPDRNVRIAALHVMKRHWGIDQSLISVLETMALTDRDDVVRDIALLYFSSCFNNTRDSRTSQLLARIIVDDSCAKETRVTAYQALFGVQGVSSESWPQTWASSFHFPEDVDWPFVNRFL
jgi:hypothetical protein